MLIKVILDFCTAFSVEREPQNTMASFCIFFYQNLEMKRKESRKKNSKDSNFTQIKSNQIYERRIEIAS